MLNERPADEFLNSWICGLASKPSDWVPTNGRVPTFSRETLWGCLSTGKLRHQRRVGALSRQPRRAGVLRRVSMSLRVLVCGGGNAAHVFLGELAARGHRTTLLSAYPGEASRLRAGCEANDGQVEVRGWSLDPSGENIGVIHGPPNLHRGQRRRGVCASRHMELPRWSGTTLFFFPLPAFAHQSYLQGVVPYIKRYSDDPDRLPVVLAAAVAQGGFDMAVRAALAAARVARV